MGLVRLKDIYNLKMAVSITKPKPVYSTSVHRTSLQYRYLQEMYREGITLTDRHYK